MKKLALLVVMLIFIGTAEAVAPPSCPASLADQVEKIVQPQLDKHPELSLGVAVDIVQPGSEGSILTHIFYFGKLVDSNGVPISLGGATEFEIGSVSKTFTATIFASLLQKNSSWFKLSTNQIFPETPTLMGEQTTLGDLANYTSGVPDSNEGKGSDTCTFGGGTITDCYELDLMFEHLSDPELSGLQFAPGTQYLYSDLGFALLALAQPILAGSIKNNPGQLRHPERLLESWDAMLGSIVLAPLGMNSTHPFSPALDPPMLPSRMRKN